MDAASSTAPLLSIEGLEIEYRDRTGARVRAVDGVDLQIERGSVLGLVGESGSGKSSVARAVVQLENYQGSIRFDGIDLGTVGRRQMRELRPAFQMIFQDSMASMDPRRSVREAIERPLQVQRIGNAGTRLARVIDLLDLVGLDESFLDRLPDTLSGGQRQRVSIARALALEPRLLVCDEPVSALDVSIQAQILTLLSDLRDRLQLTVLFISHDLAVVRHFCDTVAVMHHGRVVEHGTVDEVLFDPKDPYTQRLLAAAVDVVFTDDASVPDPEA
jgi:ABC-type glutathione transport system ATPase component